MNKKTNKSVVSKVKKTSKQNVKNKLTKEETERKFWNEVDLLAQDKIYQLLTNNIPLQNIKLITEPWQYEDKQQKLSGLFLHRDVDYRLLLGDIEEQYGLHNYQTEERPEQEYLAEEIAVWYLGMVIKSLIEEVSDYSCYDPSFFTHLTN